MNIQTTDAQGLYTKKLIAVYNETIAPTKFLGSFFPDAEPSDSLELAISATRTNEKIASDVLRGTDGNRNTFSRSTEKIFVSPYFREYWDVTSLDFYDRLWRASSISESALSDLINQGVKKTKALQDKIERAYELQRAQVLQTGRLIMSQGIGVIDFKRKAGSIVDATAAGYFANSIDPFPVFEAAGTFLRTVGKVTNPTFVSILGSQAISDLINNAKFQLRQNLFNMSLDAVAAPQRNSEGATYHGTLTAGPYRFELWTYPQYYDNAAGTPTPYIDPKNMIILPANPKFEMGWAAVPQLLEPGQAPVLGKYIVSQFTDEKKRTREYHIESAGMPILEGVDQVYTAKVVA
jgi:hypothetical protein